MYRLIYLLAVAAGPVFAEAPKVVTDIAPIHSLLAQVMDGVGRPDLIIPAHASPHGYAMRPSEARNLAQADVVVWVGPTLTPWLQGPIETLAPGAVHLTLAEVAQINVLPFRIGDAFGAEDHDHDHDHGEGQGHEGNTDGAQASDPHLWLDPQNAAIWLDAIADTLAAVDPENALTYQENADRGQIAIALQDKAIAQQLSPFSGVPFIVLHDGFHYFESHFGIEAIGAVSSGDAAKPGAARIAALRAQLGDSGVRCAFAEPQINASLLDTVTEGMDVKIGILDPMGGNLPSGPGQYAAMLGAIADSMATCLSHE